MVVTPTRKAAQVAGRQLGTWAFSAAWLAHQHGWRWDANGTWTRLDTGQIDPGSRHPGRQYVGPQHEAVLRAGDVLLVDEAGMLEQDTARAPAACHRRRGARLVLVGDRHQLPAVGRGGVLDLAARFAAPGACPELATVHRFTDPDYAPLSLAMRTGENPEQLFDTLAAKGHVQVHASEIERVDALADDAVSALTSGQPVRVLANTNDQVAQLNTAIRERLIHAGQVDDSRAMTTRARQLLGTGDLDRHRRDVLCRHVTKGVQLMASIEKRQRAAGGKVTWWAMYRTPEGKQRRKSFDRKADAVRFLTSIESAKLGGSYVNPSRSVVALGDLARTWLAGKVNLKPSTWERGPEVREAPVATRRRPAAGRVRVPRLG